MGNWGYLVMKTMARIRTRKRRTSTGTIFLMESLSRKMELNSRILAMTARGRSRKTTLRRLSRRKEFPDHRSHQREK